MCIRDSNHFALTRLADQQHAAWCENHHARAVYILGKNRNVKSWRRFQLREIEPRFSGVSKSGMNQQRQQERKRRVRQS